MQRTDRARLKVTDVVKLTIDTTDVGRAALIAPTPGSDGPTPKVSAVSMNRRVDPLHRASTRSEDTDTISRIDELVAEIRRVRAGISVGHRLSSADHHHLADLQTELDDHWNVVRRRRSDRYFRRDPKNMTTGI